MKCPIKAPPVTARFSANPKLVTDISITKETQLKLISPWLEVLGRLWHCVINAVHERSLCDVDLTQIVHFKEALKWSAASKS